MDLSWNAFKGGYPLQESSNGSNSNSGSGTSSSNGSNSRPYGLVERVTDLRQFYEDINKNKYKLRLRNLYQHFNKASIKLNVLRYVNEVLKAGLAESDIVQCEKAEPWLGNGVDIVVTFKDAIRRDRVFLMRTVMNGGLFHVCDELGRERVEIWKLLLTQFGETNLYTNDGVVVLRKDEDIKFLHLSDAQNYVSAWRLHSEAEADALEAAAIAEATAIEAAASAGASE